MPNAVKVAVLDYGMGNLHSVRVVDGDASAWL